MKHSTWTDYNISRNKNKLPTLEDDSLPLSALYLVRAYNKPMWALCTKSSYSTPLPLHFLAIL